MEALTILDRMETYGCAPNRVTISTFINGLCKEDKPDEANKLIDRCVGTCSVSKSECYSSLVMALLRVRNFDEAENVFRRMLFATTIDSEIYSIMLDGLCTKIHLLEASKLAKLMAQKSIRLKPPNIKSVVEYLKSAGEMEIFAAVELCSPRSFVPYGVSFQASRSRNEAIAGKRMKLLMHHSVNPDDACSSPTFSEQSRVCIGIIEDESRNRFEFVSEVLLLIEVEKELETHGMFGRSEWKGKKGNREYENQHAIHGYSLQHLPLSLGTNPGYPGRLVVGDSFPGRHVARDEWNGKARMGFLPGRHSRATS
ncbi:pentatricopeptide repeat-containing protein, partial [Tanacetum coccineum]